MHPGKVLGIGIMFTTAAAVAPMFFGMPPLTSSYAEFDVPLIGDVTVPSALIFDAGVYVIVVGLIMHVLASMGAYLDREEDTRKQRARDRARKLQAKNEQRRRLMSRNRRARYNERRAAAASGSSISKRERRGE